jgi:hypothetical protein
MRQSPARKDVNAEAEEAVTRHPVKTQQTERLSASCSELAIAL